MKCGRYKSSSVTKAGTRVTHVSLAEREILRQLDYHWPWSVYLFVLKELNRFSILDVLAVHNIFF